MKTEVFKYIRGLYFILCLIPYLCAISLYTLFFRANNFSRGSSFSFHYKLTGILLDSMFILLIPNIVLILIMLFKWKKTGRSFKIWHYINLLGFLIVIYILYLDRLHAFSWFVDQFSSAIPALAVSPCAGFVSRQGTR